MRTPLTAQLGTKELTSLEAASCLYNLPEWVGMHETRPVSARRLERQHQKPTQL